jgi:hypothetical protein
LGRNHILFEKYRMTSDFCWKLEEKPTTSNPQPTTELFF